MLSKKTDVGKESTITISKLLETYHVQLQIEPVSGLSKGIRCRINLRWKAVCTLQFDACDDTSMYASVTQI